MQITFIQEKSKFNITKATSCLGQSNFIWILHSYQCHTTANDHELDITWLQKMTFVSRVFLLKGRSSFRHRLESHLRITCPLAERVLKVLQPISQLSSWSLSWQNLPLLPFQSMRWPLISSFPDQSCPYWLAYRHKRQWQRRLHFNEVFDLHLQSFP